MKFSKFANWLTTSGSALILSSLVFIFYFIAVLLPFQYNNSKSIFVLLLENSCNSNRLLNSSFDFQQCLQNSNNFVTNSYPPYMQILPKYFDLTTLDTWLFFLPLILGIVLLLVGFFAKRKKK